jgi:hypothetical protein
MFSKRIINKQIMIKTLDFQDMYFLTKETTPGPKLNSFA